MKKNLFLSLLLAFCAVAFLIGCTRAIRPEDLAVKTPQISQRYIVIERPKLKHFNPTTGKRDIPIKEPVNTPAPEKSAAPEESAPAVILPEDEKTASFEQLWFVSRQWEVGSYATLVRRARLELNRRGTDVLEQVIAQFPVEEEKERRAFAEYFGSLGEKAIQPLTALLETKHKFDALSLIAALNLKGAIPALQAKKEDTEMGAPICRVLAMLGDKSVIPALKAQYETGGEPLKLRVLGALKSLGDPDLAVFFIQQLDHEFVSIRRASLNCLVALGTQVLPVLAESIEKAGVTQKRCLLEAIGMLKTRECVIVLMQHCSVSASSDWRVRFSALRALQSCKLTDEDKSTLRTLLSEETSVYCRREITRMLTEEIQWMNNP